MLNLMILAILLNLMILAIFHNLIIILDNLMIKWILDFVIFLIFRLF